MPPRRTATPPVVPSTNGEAKEPKEPRKTGRRRTRSAAATEEAAKAVEKLEQPAAIEPVEENPAAKRTIFQTTSFARMSMEWTTEDRMALSLVQKRIDDRVFEEFREAYAILSDLYDIVRIPELDANGHLRLDPNGFPVWKVTPSGRYAEDWTKLTRTERERFLFEITTRLFDWELRATDAWAESMFAKAIYEEGYAIKFDEPQRGTIDDRDAYAKVHAAEGRYFALAVTAYSRKADALVRTMRAIAQAMKDTMP